RDPDAVIAVGLAPWDLLDMRGVHEQTGEVVLQRVEHRFPVNAGALHCHVRHAVRRQPVPQDQQLADRRAERLHMLLRLAAPSADAHARRHRLLVHVQSAATLQLLFHGPPPAFASPPSVGASLVDSARRAQPATMRGAERSRVTLNPGLPVPSSGDVARTTASGMIANFHAARVSPSLMITGSRGQRTSLCCCTVPETNGWSQDEEDHQSYLDFAGTL